MRLLVISHTEHYKDSSGQIVGWGATVNELNHLSHHFEHITHLAMLYNGAAPSSSMPYTSDNICFKRLPSLGGSSLLSKLKLLFSIPKVIAIVHKELKNCDAFQLRTPTGIAVFLIPYLTIFSRKKGWFKYAGNWNQKQAPLGYRIQRWLLKRQNRIVTINGRWDNQLKHCLTFENPCLTTLDVEDGKKAVQLKDIHDKINFCYVGRLETPKGVGRIIEAFGGLHRNTKNAIGTLHLVGDGQERTYFETLAEKSDIEFKFHGFLKRDAVFDIYKKCHYFLMPTSASEGFPKVIAEAANFGCVPIVSEVSAISQYIVENKNGFIVSNSSIEELRGKLTDIVNLDNDTYKALQLHNSFVRKFTYEYYNDRVKNDIL